MKILKSKKPPLILLVVVVLMGCSSGSKDMKGGSSSVNTNEAFYDGKKPFSERVDVITARNHINSALMRVRSRVDTEYGKKEWILLENDPDKLYDSCDHVNEGGYEDGGLQGLAKGFSRKDFSRLLKIAKEELAPYGFTKVVDISDKESGWANIFNTADGGYVGLTMNRDGAFGLDYTTGCHPAPAGQKPKTAGDYPSGIPTTADTSAPR